MAVNPSPFLPQDNRKCAVKITCAGTDSPVINTSAETEDGPSFFAQRWPSIDPSQLPQPILQTFTAGNCYGTVTSNISQADADAQAERNAFLCQHTDPNGNVNQNIVGNAPQTAVANCPDGTPFTFTVTAGMFLALNQQQANAEAKSYANRQVNARIICIGNLPSSLPFGVPASLIITASGNLSPFPFSDHWELFGSLPNGLTFNGGFINAQEVAAGVESPPSITGTPSMAGIFTFSIKITNWLGDFIIKQFSISIGIPPVFAYFDFSQTASPWIDDSTGATLPFSTFVSGPGFIGKGAAYPSVNAATTTGLVYNYDASTSAGITIWFWYQMNATTTGGSLNLWFRKLPEEIIISARQFFGGGQDTTVNTATNSLSGPAASVLGSWRLLAATWDRASGDLKIYLNGILNGTHAAGTATFSSGLYEIRMECFGDSTAAIQDEVGVWGGYAATASQIAAIYNGGAGVTWPAVKSIFP